MHFKMYYVILCLILISVIPSSFSISIFSKEAETCSSSAVTDMNRTEIDVDSYCSDKSCLVKCCGQNEVVHIHGVNGRGVTDCKNIDVLKKELGETKNITDFSSVPFDYSDIIFYNNNIYKSIVNSTKKFSNFTLLQRSMFMHPPGGRTCAVQPKAIIKLLEKGTLVQYKKNQYEYWAPKETTDFCVDMSVGTKKGLLIHKAYYMIKIPDIDKMSDKDYYTAICLSISAFFLLLVLVVYSLLHQLRNIQGMLLCAYVATLFCFYMIKATLLFKASKESISDQTVITQIQYFLILASFFWLKLMSFDIWWTFRGTRKHRAIHRRGITVKFLIYASYAFGVPAAMTIFASIMDEKDLPEHVVKPFFRDGFLSHSMLFYLYTPLIILTTLNCLLFIMTVYNIWLIRRNLANFDKNTVSKNKTNQNRFMLYIKLSSIMGVSWILELVQNTMDADSIDVWLDVLINAYNLFIGVIIFFLFIFKTSIFLMLCKRFNVENRWTRRACAVNSTRSELSKISKSDSSKNSRSYARTRSTVDSEVEDGLDGENIMIRRLGSEKNTA